VGEGVPSCNGHPIGLSETSEGVEFPLDEFQRLMAIRVVLPVTTVAVQVAHTGRLKPVYRVIRESPREPVKIRMIDWSSHTYPPEERDKKQPASTIESGKTGIPMSEDLKGPGGFSELRGKPALPAS
jgi:hypothetical protein